MEPQRQRNFHEHKTKHVYWNSTECGIDGKGIGKWERISTPHRQLKRLTGACCCYTSFQSFFHVFVVGSQKSKINKKCLEYYFYSMFVLVVILLLVLLCWFFFVVSCCYAWDNTKKTSKCLTDKYEIEKTCECVAEMIMF